jgi:hypothetical protein
MPITIKKPTGGKLMKGRDHRLKCTLTWDDGTHPNLHTDIAAFYFTMKSNDSLADDDATISINSIDNPDQFILDDEATPLEGTMKIWIKKADQSSVVPDTIKYCADVVVVLTDGTEWPFITDYNIVFGQPPTRETGYGA